MIDPRNPRIRGFYISLLLVLLSLAANARNFFTQSAGNLSWNSSPVCLSHPGSSPSVGACELIEFGLDVPANVDGLFQGPHSLNPFDPEHINIVAVFSNGTETDTVYGFYYEEFYREPSSIQALFLDCPNAVWKPAFTDYKWRIRFATSKTGNWNVNVKMFFPGVWPVPTTYDGFTFEVVPSVQKGFLEIGKDKRHFKENNLGKSFFCLGQNIAWPDGPRFRGATYDKYQSIVVGGFMDVQDWITNLAKSGGNTVRVVNVPWSYELEWDTIGVYNMAHAWELDSLFSVCEMNQVKVVFCMEHGTYTLPSWYEEHMTWEKHPYHKYVKGVDMPEDFLTDSTARKLYRNKLHYFLARWGYSPSLGIVQLVSEMEHWTLRGPETELKNNKAAQRKFLAWHDEMLAYMKSQVKYRPLLTSTSYGAPPRDYSVNAFSSRYCDVVFPRHCYFTERNDNLRRWEEVNGVSLFEKGIHNMFPSKPALYDEMGFGTLGADPNDIDACNDVTYHNSLWSTAFSGTAGAGLYWWRWGSNQYREQNFPALSFFFHVVNFESTWFTNPGHWEDANRPSKVDIETFYVTSEESARWHCMGWVHNASYWWGNVSQNCKDRDGKSTRINSKTGDDASLSAPQELEAGTYFEVHDLAAKRRYKLTWYKTRDRGGIAGEEIVRTNVFGTARIPWKEGAADWGYKMELIFEK